MKIQPYFLLLILPIFAFTNNYLYSQDIKQSEAQLVGQCEGCEAVFEYGNRTLTPEDTLPEFENHTPQIKITGTIYESNGKTPAEDVILYIYHTNKEGVYPKTGNEKGWAKRHGYIRGWVKTGADGRYTFYTFKPGSYSSNPAHIHPIILEPNGRYYWLGSYFFEDDPLLKGKQRNQKSPRGGHSGVLTLTKMNGLWVGKRDIILGKNIPGYE
ncbi:intradiol ring-cleavage dioxygenase [Fodinibius saliphilus]|uniref:intradiol ring-cleavage dioxygenase n=1 Tax=Fodinibius saliphilus TaxID=1920650 RepID=UPI001108C12E|nr:intradiol ring-cleavage dioxygenase [Fodinibius saliphilus]